MCDKFQQISQFFVTLSLSRRCRRRHHPSIDHFVANANAYEVDIRDRVIKKNLTYLITYASVALSRHILKWKASFFYYQLKEKKSLPVVLLEAVTRFILVGWCFSTWCFTEKREETKTTIESFRHYLVFVFGFGKWLHRITHRAIILIKCHTVASSSSSLLSRNVVESRLNMCIHSLCMFMWSHFFLISLLFFRCRSLSLWLLLARDIMCATLIVRLSIEICYCLATCNRNEKWNRYRTNKLSLLALLRRSALSFSLVFHFFVIKCWRVFV